MCRVKTHKSWVELIINRRDTHSLGVIGILSSSNEVIYKVAFTMLLHTQALTFDSFTNNAFPQGLFHAPFWDWIALHIIHSSFHAHNTNTPGLKFVNQPDLKYEYFRKTRTLYVLPHGNFIFPSLSFLAKVESCV